MFELNLPTTLDETKNNISKMAKSLYLQAFSQYEKYIKPSDPFEENLHSIMMQQYQYTQEERVKRRLKTAGFPYVKTMNMFKMTKENLPNLNFDEVRELATCKFIDEKEDVCAIGPSGHGKTHLMLAIGYEAVCRGYSVKFRRACDLINEMREATDQKKLSNYLKMMSRCSLLIIDEMGYLDYDTATSNLLYQVIGSRYETASTMYTSNLEFSKWPQFIEDESLAKAIVTRIAHQAVLLDMNGPKAWRLEHARSKRSNNSADKEKSAKEGDSDD